MNPELLIQSRLMKDYACKKSVRFAITDQNAAKTYLQTSFVYTLVLKSAKPNSSAFAKTCRESGLEVAEKLLKDALRIEADLQIKKRNISTAKTDFGKNCLKISKSR